jgi:type IV secretion system protein VirB1
LGLTLATAFEPCNNLAAMQTVLGECFERAQRVAGQKPAEQAALQRALSCYYSGNFSTGFRHGYVRKVVAAAPSTSRSRSDSPTSVQEAP